MTPWLRAALVAVFMRGTITPSRCAASRQKCPSHMSTMITAVFATSQSTVRSTTLNSLLPGALSWRSRRLSRSVPGTLGRLGRFSLTGSCVSGGAANAVTHKRASMRMCIRFV